MNNIPRYNVLGVGVSALSLDTATRLIVGARGKRHLGYVCFGTVHGVSEARKNPRLRRVFNTSLLTTPDGMPLVWLGRRCGFDRITRVYGPDLMLAVCDAGRAVGLRHFFYGGNPGVAEALAQKLTARFPGLEVAGTGTPPFRPLNDAEFTDLQDRVARARPDLIWVGLGTPKQELFMADAWDRLDCGLMLGVGAAFDFHSGRVRQAPRWMQRSGLEWLFRFSQEPRRLAYRYLIYNPLFVLRTFAQLTGLRRYPLETDPAN